MGLPSSMTTRQPGRLAFSGIELAMFPSTNRNLSIELWSATANSTATSIWGKVVFPPTQFAEFRHTVLLPLSTRTYHFKARHPAQPGYSAGPLTITVNAKPVLLASIQPPPPPVMMTYKGNMEPPVPVQASADSGTAITVDFSGGPTQQVRLTGTATVTFTNVVDGSRYRVWFQQDTVGSRPFPTINETVMFTNGVAPTLTTTPGAIDLFEFEYRTNPTNRFTCMPLQTNVLLPSPVIVSTGDGGATSGTSFPMTMPSSISAGNLLLMYVRVLSSTVNTPTGWTLIDVTANTYLFAKVAVGGDTVTVTTAESTMLVASILNINRWFGQLSGVEEATATGISAAPDSPSLTATWTDRTLWLSGFGTGVDSGGIASRPSGYTAVADVVVTDAVNFVEVHLTRLAKYATTENPGAWGTQNSIGWSAITIAVRPPA